MTDNDDVDVLIGNVQINLMTFHVKRDREFWLYVHVADDNILKTSEWIECFSRQRDIKKIISELIRQIDKNVDRR